MKMPNGYGSVYKLKGTRRKPWVARKTVGWDINEETGKANPKYLYVGYYATRSEALAALAEYNKDPYDLSGRIFTLKDVMDLWEPRYATSVSPATYRNTKTALKKLEGLFNDNIATIKLWRLQSYFDKIPASKIVKDKTKLVLGMLFDYAIKYEIIPPERRQVVTYIDTSSLVEVVKRDRKIFTADEVAEIWSREPSLGRSYLLALLYTGARYSELLAIRKEDVHLEARYFDIVAAKTESGVRSVPICDKLLPIFEELLKTDNEYIFRFGAPAQTTPTIFLRVYWPTLGTGHYPHDARHTFISRLQELDCNEAVLHQIVGHKDNDTTRKVYTHISIVRKLQAVNTLEY